MKLQRTLPPAASPIDLIDLLHGFMGIVQGKKAIDRFRNELKQHYDVKHCFLVSSGKAALYCILKALQKIHPEKNEVLVPAFNCYSVPSAVLSAGCTIRLCDVDPETLDFAADESAKALKNSTRLLCIVPAHLFGLHADIPRLKREVHDSEVTIVEDAAQAMGSMENGTPLGLLGDVGFFSLGRGKAFSTYEGGIIVTNDDTIGKSIAEVVATFEHYSTMQVIRLCLQAVAVSVLSHPMLFWIPKGLPFLRIGETLFEHSFTIRSMSSFQAGLAWNWKKKMQRFLDRRKQNSDWWASYFYNHPIQGILTFVSPGGPLIHMLRFPIRVSNPEIRDKILKKSEELGLGISVTYPKALDELVELNGKIAALCPDARVCAGTIITLPIHGYVQRRDVNKISKVITEIADA